MKSFKIILLLILGIITASCDYGMMTINVTPKTATIDYREQQVVFKTDRKIALISVDKLETDSEFIYIDKSVEMQMIEGDWFTIKYRWRTDNYRVFVTCKENQSSESRRIVLYISRGPGGVSASVVQSGRSEMK